MKILLSAFSCGATKTSEPGNAWRVVNHALSRGHEVWTIAEKGLYEADMRAHLAANPMPNYHPVFLEMPFPVVTLRGHGFMMAAIHYYLWQQKLLTFARELHQKIGFDVAQHVTFGRYWTPSGVRDLGIPFIWGPVGAADSAPPSFLAELPFRDRMFEYTRDGIRALSHFDPALKDTARKATISLGITREACEAIRELGGERVEQMPSGVLGDEELALFDNFPPLPKGPFRAVCLGRLLHWKGFHLAIRAFALFAGNHPDAELWIIGSGPFRQELEKTATQTGAGPCVRFLGQMSHTDAMDRLAQAHILLHPALHDNFPGVCIEAMAAGRPVACLDIGGPAIQVTPETGFIAPVTSPEEAVQALAGFLARAADDRPFLEKMSAKARIRVRENFTLSRMGAALDALWNEAYVSKDARIPASVT